MKSVLLHDVITDVLIAAKEPLSVSEIHKIIYNNKLWYRPKDQKLPKLNK